MNIIVCEIPLAGISGEFSKIIEEKDGVSALIYSEEISDYTPLNRVRETWQAPGASVTRIALTPMASMSRERIELAKVNVIEIEKDVPVGILACQGVVVVFGFQRTSESGQKEGILTDLEGPGLVQHHNGNTSMQSNVLRASSNTPAAICRATPALPSTFVPVPPGSPPSSGSLIAFVNTDVHVSPFSPDLGSDGEALTRTLPLKGGIFVTFCESDIPNSPVVGDAKNFEDLLGVWNDRFPQRSGNSPLKIIDVPIPLIYWPSVYKYWKGNQWKGVKKLWSQWKSRFGSEVEAFLLHSNVYAVDATFFPPPTFDSAEDSPKKRSLDFGIRPRKFHGFKPDSQDVALGDLGFILDKLSVSGVDVK
ncbi:hypothetical protein B0H14DRAFT_3127900 [Mycena olivaceomarginata]|nr:hypothetical protein B0H14DRAFT_3127900 [Mycena olivaceomarginata]